MSASRWGIEEHGDEKIYKVTKLLCHRRYRLFIFGKGCGRLWEAAFGIDLIDNS